MPSFGENLRREREKRKITLDQISQSTKIGIRMLQALEEDKFSQLPGGIFNKGFVRAYARSVGLDEEQTIADYLEASGDSPPVMPEIPPAQPAPRIIEAEEETSRRPLPWGMFATLLLLAALALSLWSRHQKRESPVTAPQPTPNQPAAEHVGAPAPAPTVTTPASNLAARAAASQTSTPSNSATPSNPSAGTARTTAAPPPESGFVMNIQAREDSWTVITSDGKTVYSGLLAAGDQRAIRGQKEIVVKAGNSGGVDLYFNGKKIPAVGQYGEIRTVTFGPAGVIPTPSPTAPAPH